MKLPPEQGEKLFTRLLATPEQTSDLAELSALTKTVVAVAGKLPPEQAEKLVTRLLATPEQTSNPVATEALIPPSAGLSASPVNTPLPCSRV
jgi:hypothetical protein